MPLIGPSATTVNLGNGQMRLYVTGAVKEEDDTYRTVIFTILKTKENGQEIPEWDEVEEL